MTCTERISKPAKRTTFGVTGTYICTFYSKMYNSVHAFGIDKIPSLRETPYFGSPNNNDVWIISLFKLTNL